MSSVRGDERGSFTSGLAFGIVNFGLVAVVGIASSIATARILGIQVIGEFALAYAPTALVWSLSSVREQAALVRELSTLPPRDPRVTGLFAAVLTFSSVLTLLVSAVAVVAVVVIFNGPLDQPDLVWPAIANLAAYALVANVGWNLDSIFSAFVAGRMLFWIRLHQAVANLILGVAFGLALDSVWALVLAVSLSQLTSLIHRFVAVRRIMRLRTDRGTVRAGFATLPAILRFGVRAAPGAIFQGLANELGTWVLGLTSSVATVGAYNRAWMLGRKFLEVSFRITEMLLPTLVKRRADGDQAGFDRALVDSMRYSAAGMLLIAAAGGGAAPAIMALFGAGFGRASDALVVLLLLPGMYTLSAIQTHAFYAVDRPLATTMMAGVRLGVTAVATIAGVHLLGITGVAIGLVGGAFVDAGIKLLMLRPHLGSRFTKLWTPRQIVATVVAYAAGFAVSHLCIRFMPEPWDILAAVSAGTVVYAAALVAAGGIGRRDIDRMRRGAERLRRRAEPGAPQVA